MTAVSVIIPVFNNQDSLERAVYSVIYEPLVSEVIIVDDGSTDNSLKIVKDLASKHEIVKLIVHPLNQNKGATASRNLGLVNAKSVWIQFLDADDELMDGKIREQVASANSEISFIVGNAIDCFEDGHRHVRKFFRDPWAGLISGKLGITSANLWNKKFLDKVGGWQESLTSSQEYDLMFRLLKENEKVGFCDMALTKIHRRKNSISNDPVNQNQRVNNWLNLRNDIKSYLKRNNKFSLNRNYIFSGYMLEFCQRNGCIELFDGSLFLGKVFQFEKKIKQKIHSMWKN